jgi:hypothetical protein
VLQDPGGQDPDTPVAEKQETLQPDIPALSIVKRYEPPPPPPGPKSAGSSANLQNLTNGNPPSGFTAVGRIQDEADTGGALTLTLPNGGKLTGTGSSSFILARRAGLFQGEHGLGGEFGVYASSSLDLPSPAILQGTLHLGDDVWGLYLQLGKQTDASGKTLGTAWSILESQGATSKDQSRQFYVNESVVHTPSAQVSGKDVTDVTSGTLLVGAVYDPLVKKSSEKSESSAANQDVDKVSTPSSSSGDELEAGSTAFGAEVAGSINTGLPSTGGGSARSYTGTALLFLTHAFDDKKGIFGVALGASYESGGGGATVFLRFGIAFDKSLKAAEIIPFRDLVVTPPFH